MLRVISSLRLKVQMVKHQSLGHFELQNVLFVP